MTLPREPGHRKSTVPDAAPLPVNTSQGGWSLGSKKQVPAHGDGSSQLPLGKLEVKIQSSQGKVILKGSCSSLNPQSPGRKREMQWPGVTKPMPPHHLRQKYLGSSCHQVFMCSLSVLSQQQSLQGEQSPRHQHSCATEELRV